MRSHTILRKSQFLLGKSPISNHLSYPRPSCIFRENPRQSLDKTLFLRHFSSSDASNGVSSDYPDTPDILTPSEASASQEPLELRENSEALGTTSSTLIEPDPRLSEELSKVKIRRARVIVPSTKDSETVDLPDDLAVFWLPEEATNSLDSSVLPPPEAFEEALHNLLVTLHPQIQHRALYPPENESAVEPTFGLYCPIEGGDYIIDATVREIARQIGAEVLVLDAVQLAAGEGGEFGKAANALQLPRNPLHFSFSTHSPSLKRDDGDEDDESPDLSIFPAQHMKLTVLTPTQGRTIMNPSSRRTTPRSKIKVFFDTLVNLAPSKTMPQNISTIGSRPRLIYIRDFPTLSPTSSVWYPPLLSAVKQRRRGPISRPSSAVFNPITIIFGMTPPLTPPASYGAPGPNSNLMNYLMSRNSSTSMVAQGPKQERLDWSETEVAEKARERRLIDRLKRWEKNEPAFMEEFPKLATNVEADSDSSQRPDLVLNIGPSIREAPGLSQLLGPVLLRNDGNSDSEGSATFFRTSILVPRVRSSLQERTTRIARRREINELSMRMAIATVGGSVERKSAQAFFADSTSAGDESSGSSSSPSMRERMWEDWGNKIAIWSDMKKVANSAVGRILTPSHGSAASETTTLDPTLVSWLSIQSAWVARKLFSDQRKLWVKDVASLSNNNDQLETKALGVESESVDEIVDSVKNDDDLEPHEQRLLGCIVDSASMSTSFNQVHLAPHIIDSVRTIVSLPLLHPRAFQHGILKSHSMTGCLLFGPPGTGKTLLVRALAKEAGCRMLAISPSDVVDMYVGEGEKLVRAVFSLARRLSPCVVFLDEIDALFGARMSARESGGAVAHRGIITEFMQEMDGLKSSRDDGVIVIGATNRPFDLDDAVLRRLPRRLLVDLPGEKEREEILKILLHDEILAPEVTHQILAKRTESFSGSDLKHLCVSAALDAVKEHVHVPWNVVSSTSLQTSDVSVTEFTPSSTPVSESQVGVETPSDQSVPVEAMDTTQAEIDLLKNHTRILQLRNFTKALKEITPSSSESLGSLSDLRKWNEEFGEGQRNRRHRQVWGKGRFGFVDERGTSPEEGRVTTHSSSIFSLERDSR